MIADLEPFLRRIEPWPEISAINPGEINPRSRRGGSPFLFSVQYHTESGLKCIARSQGVQEVFLVTSEPDALEEKLRTLKEVK